MQVSVKVIPEVKSGVCSVCTGGVTETVIVLNLFSGTGSEESAPRCLSCFEAVEVIDFDLKQIDETATPKPPSRQIKKRSQMQERAIAEDIGGSVQRASGALPGAKGDVRVRGKHRVEAKMTGNKQYVLRRATLDKIRSEASFGEKPALVVSFVHKGTLREEDRWVVIPYEDWKEGVDAAGDN